VRNFFEPADAERLIEGSRSQQNPHFVFHRQLLLFVAKEAILHCPAEGLDPLVQRPGPVGTLFLLANDHLHYGFPQTDDHEQKLLNALTEFVVVGEYSGYHAFRNGIARGHLMYSRFSDELRADPDYTNFRERFATLVGMPIDEFQAYALRFCGSTSTSVWNPTPRTQIVFSFGSRTLPRPQFQLNGCTGSWTSCRLLPTALREFLNDG
jgi:hypothetical protein